jgi:hypothetical protein
MNRRDLICGGALTLATAYGAGVGFSEPELSNPIGSATPPQSTHELAIAGARFLLDGKLFPYTGVSFFNAIYNPNFNRSSEERVRWLRKFKTYGVNVLRVWAQWDSKQGFVDTRADCTLYFPDGRLRSDNVDRLKEFIVAADSEGMVIELTLFSQESWHDGIRLGKEEADRAVASITHELLAYRNVAFQVWNEFSERVPDHVSTIKAADPKRLVTNSPGGAGTILGEPAQQEALDYLSPHTSRQAAGNTWVIAPAEVQFLLDRYNKPVVDDEPARNGTRQFGGPGEQTYPYDHILQIWEDWRVGCYVNYHHDMFQTGYGSASVPPSGIPDPEFSPYHRVVFEFLAQRHRYAPQLG